MESCALRPIKTDRADGRFMHTDVFLKHHYKTFRPKLEYKTGMTPEEYDTWREKVKEKLLEILWDIEPDVDYENETALIDDGILDSMEVLELVSTLEDEFDIEVTPTELVPANFNSAESMWKMIGRLQG